MRAHAGGFVSGLLFHPAQRGLLYARTDVGGAYRWDAPASHWVALTDWLGAAEAHLVNRKQLPVSLLRTDTW